MGLRRLIIFVLLVVALAACGESLSEVSTVPSSPQTTEGQIETSVVPTTEAVVTTMAADAAPPEMEGRWVAEIEGQAAPHNRAELSLTGTNYGITWGPDSHGGTISVVGDTIYFTNISCEGSGAYRWVVEGDTLTLTELEHEPCIRSAVLNGVTYTRG